MSTGRTPERPFPVVARELVTDLQSLVTQEIGLAKAEVTEVVVKAAKAAALFAVAGVLGLYLLGFALSLLARVLDIWLPTWAAWLIVVVVIALLIGLLGWIGYRMLPRSAPGTAAKEEFATTKVALTGHLAGLRTRYASSADGTEENRTATHG